MEATKNTRKRVNPANGVTLTREVVSTAPVPAPHDFEQGYTHVDLAECVRRVRVAAWKACKGMKRGPEFTADCAADVLGAVLTAYLSDNGRLSVRYRCSCGAPARVMVSVDSGTPGVYGEAPRCYRHANPYGKYTARPIRSNPEGLPVESVTMSRLWGMASNWRNRHLTAVAADKRAAEEAAATGVQITRDVMPWTEVPQGKAEAWQRAQEILVDLGILHGKLWVLAYATMRESAGLTRAEIAAELGMKQNTLNVHLKRAAAADTSAYAIHSAITGSHTYREHAEALRVDEYTEVRKRTAPTDYTQHTSHDPREWRDGQDNAPQGLTITYGPATADAWDGNTTSQWAKDFNMTTREAAGLAHLARLNREHKTGQRAIDRDAKRAANGLPPLS